MDTTNPQPSQDRISFDFHSLPGALAINYGTRVAVYNNDASARTFEMWYPDWTTKVSEA